LKNQPKARAMLLCPPEKRKRKGVREGGATPPKAQTNEESEKEEGLHHGGRGDVPQLVKKEGKRGSGLGGGVGGGEGLYSGGGIQQLVEGRQGERIGKLTQRGGST